MSNLSILRRSHWVFDMDGTLTLPVHDFDGIRQQLGLPEKCDILSTISAMPLQQGTQVREELNQIELELAKKSQPALGVNAFLSYLHEGGCQLGILTRNTRENALITVEAIGLLSLFAEEAIIGCDEAKPKPDPDGIFRLADQWNVNPNQMVMVGDYLYDLQAGRAAGTATIHVDTSSTFPWKPWMDLGITSLEELYQQRKSDKF